MCVRPAHFGDHGRRGCSWRAAYGRAGVCVSDSSMRTRVGSSRTAVRRGRVSAGEGAGRFGGCWMCRGRVVPAACLGGRSGLPWVGRGSWSRLAERPVALPAAVCRVVGASSRLPRGVQPPVSTGQAGMAMRSEFRFSLLWRGLSAAQRPRNPVGEQDGEQASGDCGLRSATCSD